MKCSSGELSCHQLKGCEEGLGRSIGPPEACMTEHGDCRAALAAPGRLRSDAGGVKQSEVSVPPHTFLQGLAVEETVGIGKPLEGQSQTLGEKTMQQAVPLEEMCLRASPLIGAAVNLRCLTGEAHCQVGHLTQTYPPSHSMLENVGTLDEERNSGFGYHNLRMSAHAKGYTLGWKTAEHP